MSKIPIFLASDNNYAPFIATTIASICDNTKEYCEFYILDGGISNENQEKICKLRDSFCNFSIEYLKIDMENDLKSVEYRNECVHVTLSTYNRFLIPKLKPSLKKVLYLDVDIIVLDDISELYGVQLGDYSFGAVSEISTNPQNSKDRSFALNLDDNHEYFNAGILLIDIQKWIKGNISQKLFEIEQKYRHKLKWADQDILNIAFNNNYLKLPEKFNFMTGEQSINEDIIIRHFNTDLKPWNFLPNLTSSLVKNCDDFWRYMKMTEFYDEVINKCTYRTQEDLHKLKFQKIMRKMNVKK